MNNGQLIDQVRSALDLPSDYALAKLWDIPIPTISGWRHGRDVSDYFLVRAAETLDKDPRELIAIRELDKHPTGVKRWYWETLLRKLFGVASAGAFTAALTASFDITPNDATPINMMRPAGAVPKGVGSFDDIRTRETIRRRVDLSNNYAQYRRRAWSALRAALAVWMLLPRPLR